MVLLLIGEGSAQGSAFVCFAYPSPPRSAALRYAAHDSLVSAAFSGLFLLKMAHLFSSDLDLNAITTQVEQLAQLLSDVAAERYARCLVHVRAVPRRADFRTCRYALTLRIMLANLRRKVGLSTSGISTPMQHMLAPGSEPIMLPNPIGEPSIIAQPFTVEELGFAWSANVVSPAEIPLWLQEQVSLHAHAWICRAIVVLSLTCIMCVCRASRTSAFP